MRRRFDHNGLDDHYPPEPPTLWTPRTLPEAVEKRNEPAMVLSSAAGERRKDLGQFFTPPALVTALTNWAIRSADDRVLEPAAGEAAFILAALGRLRELGSIEPSLNVVGVELDGTACAVLRRVLSDHREHAAVLNRDFFEVAPESHRPFTAVIGNPPYIRYHRFRGEARRKAQLAATAAGVVLNGLASSWAAFVAHSTRFLAPGGRLAFVLPAELMHADYARPVREFLLRRFGSVTVVTFDEAVFPGATIDTILLMAEDGEQRGLRVVRVRDAAKLDDIPDDPFASVSKERWSALRGDGDSALEPLRGRGLLRRVGKIASVDIGFVTGANDFFLLSLDEAKRNGISPRLLQAAVARPGQLKGAVFRETDGAELAQKEQCNVLALTAPGLDERQTALGRYLRRGKRHGVHRGYKCRVRSPWYSVPGIRIPDAFMSYMSSVAPRIVLNEAGFSSSNLVHQLTFHLTERAMLRAFIAALHSSPALLSFELEGRSYGGGVLKHETREAERVEFPFVPACGEELAEILDDVDIAVREGGHIAAADLVDRVFLRHGLIANEELERVRNARGQLHMRRVTRGRTA